MRIIPSFQVFLEKCVPDQGIQSTTPDDVLQKFTSSFVSSGEIGT